MPLIDQLFTNIIANPPIVNPGAGGWDTLLSQFMADHRGRHGFGLLGRLVDVTGIPTGSEGTIIITCPPGWIAMPLCVLVFASTNPNGKMNFTIDTGVGGDKGWAMLVDINQGSPFVNRPTIVFPSPEDTNFFADSQLPLQVPLIDGDDNDRNTFRVNLDDAIDIPYSFFVYGAAWPSSD